MTHLNLRLSSIKLSKLSLLLVLFFSTSLIVNAQKLISSDELTPNLLKETFENAFIEVLEVKETYVKVKDVYSVFLDIDPKKRYVTLSGVYQVVEGAKKQEVYELMNKINTEVALIKIFYNENTNTVSYYYYFYTEGGFTQKSLVYALKLYKDAITLSLQKDTEKLIK
ncbi:MAG: hypothetical protein P1U44_02430 [Vicingaceae bacterium]|jgi:putative sensory transduction regulator|nr:hypothetical protein [Flavobacteriales bacterium]MDF1674545.1 hypothetical protein [Vicingaceae bacterium]|tara:strand:+ start:292328 stop:292831 length:504 start_codon:yes stop_codon:yes gene_type:complete